jgi:hypothetical protein
MKKIYQHLRLDCRPFPKINCMLRQLRCPFGDSGRSLLVDKQIIERLISEHGDLVCLEVMPKLYRGHEDYISDFFQLRVQ